MNVQAGQLRNADPGPAGAGSDQLYARHETVYSQRITGRFRKFKWSALAVLLGIYYLAPWLRWDRGPDAPDQALLIDMPGRRAYLLPRAERPL